jgi:hypothetical protein
METVRIKTIHLTRLDQPRIRDSELTALAFGFRQYARGNIHSNCYLGTFRKRDQSPSHPAAKITRSARNPGRTLD